MLDCKYVFMFCKFKGIKGLCFSKGIMSSDLPGVSNSKELNPSMQDETVKLPLTCLKPLNCLTGKPFYFHILYKVWSLLTMGRSDAFLNRGSPTTVVFAPPFHGTLPIHQPRLEKPDDGMPAITDWLQTAESMF